MAPWIVPGKPMDGGEKGGREGKLLVHPKMGKKFAFPHGHWQNEMDLCFFSLAKGQLSN